MQPIIDLHPGHADLRSRYIILIHVVFFALQISAAVLVLAERKVAAFSQQRLGPYRVGWWGILQPLADILKLLFKEELRPKAADFWLFYLAPVISATTAFAAFVVIPFGPPTDFFGLLPEPINLQGMDVNVAVLIVFAITSMGVYGIVLAGWASNSKYSLLGGLRSSAQMLSLRAVLRPRPGLGASSSATRCRCARSSTGRARRCWAA